MNNKSSNENNKNNKSICYNVKSANRVIILLSHFHTINESTVRHLGILNSYTENTLAVITVPLLPNGSQPV